MRVAVLGLGRMGTPIAQRLKDAGHTLSVWNRSPAACEPFRRDGIPVLAQPADAWSEAELAITMLADDAALRAVALGSTGLLHTQRADAGAPVRARNTSDAKGARGDGTRGVLVDMSTISARCSAQIAEAAQASKRGYLRAPVSGNPSVVVAGNLTIMASGPKPTFDASVATLRDIGPNVFYVGAAEQARIVKLALNLMLGGTTQLLAEALVLGERSGIEPAKLLEVIGASAIGSPYVKYKTEALVARDYRSTFTASLLYKDLALALEAGHDARVPLPLTAATQQLVEGTIAAGMGDMDLSALVERARRELLE